MLQAKLGAVAVEREFFDKLLHTQAIQKFTFREVLGSSLSMKRLNRLKK